MPRFLSHAAAAMAVGESASFEAKSFLAFGDPARRNLGERFDVDPAADVVLDLEILSLREPTPKLHDVGGARGTGAVLKVITRGGTGWRVPAARSDVEYRVMATHKPTKWAWPGDEFAADLLGYCPWRRVVVPRCV